MSYVFARQNRKSEKIDVVERINGKRIYSSFPIDYSFYVDDQNGHYKSLYNTPISKITPKTYGECKKEIAVQQSKNKKMWESDLNPVFKCLSTHYRHAPVPDLHVALFDIEVAFDKVHGYAPIDDPFNPITSITIHTGWTNQLITLAVPPESMSVEQAEVIAAKFDNTVIFESEIEMINTFLDIIEDADIIAGWNSEGFDLPYVVNRITRVMSADDTKRLCLWGEKPKEKSKIKYGEELKTYDLVGRIHLDLLEVYRKFTYEERHSYSLNAIAEHELKKSKTPYSGSLDDLYNRDFELFIEYNRQDVILLVELEDKLKFMPLLNGLAHDTTTLMPTCMGTVSMIDQAIINRAHDLGFIVHNRKKQPDWNEEEEKDDTDGAVGAYVAAPKSGIHKWVGVIDVNGLYPSAIRALNMGVETIIGQLRPTLTDFYVAEKFKEQSNMTFAHAWEGVFASLEYTAVMERKPGVDIVIDWEHDSSSDTITAEQCYNLIFNSGQPWMLSGNGTIFTHSRDAIIPGLLAIWIKERKAYQKHAADMKLLSDGVEISPELLQQLS